MKQPKHRECKVTHTVCAESRPGVLAPESVLLTTTLQSLKFIVGASWAVSSPKPYSLSSSMRSYTDISLGVKEVLDFIGV